MRSRMISNHLIHEPYSKDRLLAFLEKGALLWSQLSGMGIPPALEQNAGMLVGLCHLVIFRLNCCIVIWNNYRFCFCFLYYLCSSYP